MDFGQPNVEIGWKMANGQLLFLALYALVGFSKKLQFSSSSTKHE